MDKTKHVADASQKVEAYFDALPPSPRAICMKLREIVLKSDPSVKEEWEQGPYYYTRKGGLCEIAGFKKHATLTFLKGVVLKDEEKILSAVEGDPYVRCLKLTGLSELNEPLLLDYIEEAMQVSKKGKKLLGPKEKTIEIPEDMQEAFKAAKLLKYFENLALSHRRDFVLWITAAKQPETRALRIAKAIDKLSAREMMREKYK